MLRGSLIVFAIVVGLLPAMAKEQREVTFPQILDLRTRLEQGRQMEVILCDCIGTYELAGESIRVVFGTVAAPYTTNQRSALAIEDQCDLLATRYENANGLKVKTLSRGVRGACERKADF